MTRRHERPLRRVNPGGKIVFVARWTDKDGRRTSAGTYDLRGPCRDPQADGECCAQHRIEAMYDAERERLAAPKIRPGTVSDYAALWLCLKPRTRRTNLSYNTNAQSVMAAMMSDGRRFGDWPMRDVRRRQANEIVRYLLVDAERARSGAQLVIAVLRVMWQDAIEEEYAELNPFIGVRIHKDDERISKTPREVRVWSWREMHTFAKCATGSQRGSIYDVWLSIYGEALVRTLSDCGLRMGEARALERQHVLPGACDEPWCPCRRVPGGAEVPHLHVVQHAWRDEIIQGTKRHEGRAVPLPPHLRGLLASLPPRIDSPLLFPSPMTRRVLRDDEFYRQVWRPAQRKADLDARPHEFRHSFISLVAPGVDQADLAAAAGHTVQTMNSTYRHALGLSFQAIASAVEG